MRQRQHVRVSHSSHTSARGREQQLTSAPPPPPPCLLQQQMKTNDVRVDVKLNKAVWSQGIRNVPNRLRIVIQRKRNEDDDEKEEMYSLVTLAEDQATKGKGVVVLEA